MWLRLKKGRRAYYEAAKLLRRTTWIESTIQQMGGEGSGLVEKLNSIADKLPNEIIKKVDALSKVRNKVVHSNPQIENPKEVYALCTKIEKILHDRNRCERLSKEIGDKIRAFEERGGTIALLPHTTQSWIDRVATQHKRCTLCGEKPFHTLLSQRRKHFFIIGAYTKWYSFVKILWVVVVVAIVGLLLIFAYNIGQ